MRKAAVSVALATCAVFALPQVASAARPRCLGQRATIVGTARADVLVGTGRSDVIVGLRGGDTIKGLGGDDIVCGGRGTDTLFGGGGGDLLLGDAGNDGLNGGRGSDLLAGGQGVDAFDGGAGFDLVSFFWASTGVQVDLTAGTAIGEGSDTLTGVEFLEGSEFDDTMTGDDGSNLFVPQDGDDTVDGGGATDVVALLFSAAAVAVDLTAGTATGEGTDSLTAVEAAFGSTFDDTIAGDAGPNFLYGEAGDDVVSGLAGDDTLDGGDGTDTLDGGDGTDTCTTGETTTNCEVEQARVSAAAVRTQALLTRMEADGSR